MPQGIIAVRSTNGLYFLPYVDGQADMAKLMASFRSFCNALSNIKCRFLENVQLLVFVLDKLVVL